MGVTPRVAVVVRVALSLLVLACLGFAVLNFTTGQPERGAADLAGGAIAAAMFAVSRRASGVAQSAARANRPRPDYSRIAELEREIYGRTFDHAGAPLPPPVRRRPIYLPSSSDYDHDHTFGNCAHCRTEAQLHGRSVLILKLPPWAPPVDLDRFLADLPDGATITTDPETAGVIRSAIGAAGRAIAVQAYPFIAVGDLCANWDGPAAGEHHEIRTWL